MLELAATAWLLALAGTGLLFAGVVLTQGIARYARAAAAVLRRGAPDVERSVTLPPSLPLPRSPAPTPSQVPSPAGASADDRSAELVHAGRRTA